MRLPLLLFMLVMTINGFGQVYVEVGVDPNKIFGIMDNPRTEEQNRGIDFDIELGTTVNKLGLFLFYGRFEAADYQNYGAGADYRLIERGNLEISLGSALTIIKKRQGLRENQGTATWKSYLGWDARVKGIYWITSGVGVTGTFQYQRRTDLEIHGILEGKIGARIKLRFPEK